MTLQFLIITAIFPLVCALTTFNPLPSPSVRSSPSLSTTNHSFLIETGRLGMLRLIQRELLVYFHRTQLPKGLLRVPQTASSLADVLGKQNLTIPQGVPRPMLFTWTMALKRVNSIYILHLFSIKSTPLLQA